MCKSICGVNEANVAGVNWSEFDGSASNKVCHIRELVNYLSDAGHILLRASAMINENNRSDIGGRPENEELDDVAKGLWGLGWGVNKLQMEIRDYVTEMTESLNKINYFVKIFKEVNVTEVEALLNGVEWNIDELSIAASNYIKLVKDMEEGLFPVIFKTFCPTSKIDSKWVDVVKEADEIIARHKEKYGE